METININFNRINFGRLEPNSLYAIKFSSFWSAEKACEMIDLLNDEGEKYGIKFIPFIAGMEIVNGLQEKILDSQTKPRYNLSIK